MSEVLYINEETVQRLLNWDDAFKAMEVVMESVTKNNIVQSVRTFTRCAKTGSLLLTMPGYLDNENFGALGCKLVTLAPNNANLERPLPTINANIMLFDEETGLLRAIVAGTEITKWRTAAASAVATKYLTVSKKCNILAVLGAGTQGKSHAIAFHHFFEFTEIRIWNRTKLKSEKLAKELNEKYETSKFVCFESVDQCVKDADVIVTATYAQRPILQLEWLKKGVHINAVGAGVTHHAELSESIYSSSNTEIYIDHWSGADVELAGLKELGVEFKGEIGSLVTGELAPPSLNQLTVFQSLGMATEDCAMARFIYDHYKKQSPN